MKALRILIFVIVMGTVSGALLVGVNSYTLPLIAKNEELKLKASVLDVFEISYDKTNLVDIFNDNVNTLEKNEYTFYNAKDGAVAFELKGPGLWGPVSGIISLEKDLNTIRKIKITHQEETPGLGGRIAESDYLKQFKTKRVLPQIVFKKAGESSGENEVDAITGATGSSKALEKLLNNNIRKYLTSYKG